MTFGDCIFRFIAAAAAFVVVVVERYWNDVFLNTHTIAWCGVACSVWSLVCAATQYSFGCYVIFIFKIAASMPNISLWLPRQFVQFVSACVGSTLSLFIYIRTPFPSTLTFNAVGYMVRNFVSQNFFSLSIEFFACITVTMSNIDSEFRMDEIRLMGILLACNFAK